MNNRKLIINYGARRNLSITLKVDSLFDRQQILSISLLDIGIKSVPDSFAAYYEPGPNWVKGKLLKEQPLKTHVDYLVSLHKKGKLSMGGPLADGSGGLVIFTAEDQEEVDMLLLSDPAIESGVLIATVKKWSRIV